jgi:hypothetical protein
MKKSALLLLCLTLGLGGAWASVGSTNPADFPTDYVNWCQFGCGAGVYTTPQAWVSFGTGYTGLVGNTNAQNWQNLQQSTSWGGNFATNMGLVYNGVSTIGTTPTSIGIYLDQPVFGIGAWIQADWFGGFTASVTLLDSNLSPMFTYFANGNSTSIPNTALFIGAYDGTADIWGVIFNTTANGFHDQDFAIGEVRIGSPVPEPSTLLLLVPSVLGLGGVLRRRLARRS